MKALHLISNHKLTGPVDPAIRLARALRDCGIDSRVAVGRPALGEGPIDGLVRERGLEPVRDLYLPKHRRFFRNRRDIRRLAEMLRAEPVDLLHAHLDNAHGLALRATAELPSRPRIIRSLYDSAPPRPSKRYRHLYSEVDGVFTYSERVRARLVEDFRIAPERVVAVHGAVVTERFRPRLPGEDLRERFGIPRDAVVVGIVARIQRHRRFPVLLEAVSRVMAELPDVWLLVLGRGTHAEEIAHAAVRRLGIGDRTRLPGYVGGDDYPAAVATFDLKVFLVPGSDGTCRAVREAMACGVPIVASRRGLLPEIVRDGIDGYVVDDTVEPLAAAIRRLASDAALRRRMGESALARAREDFCQKKQAELVAAAYRRWVEMPRASANPS